MRVLRFLIISSLLVAGASVASSPSGSAWRSVSFVTEGGDRIEIEIDRVDRSLAHIKLSEQACSKTLRHVKFPGYVDLSGVGYFKDEDDSGPFSVLVVPYVVNNAAQDHGRIALNFKACKLTSKDIYGESEHGNIRPVP